MLAISFLGAVPEHHCKIPEGGSLEDSIPHMVDPDTGQLEYDSCTVYVQDGTESNRTKECDQWEYSKEPYGDTIVNEVMNTIFDDVYSKRETQCSF